MENHPLVVQCDVNILGMAASRKDEETGYAYTRSSSIGNTESEAGSESESKPSSPSSSRKRKRSFSESTMGVPAQERWDEMFERLKAYKAVNGRLIKNSC